MGEDQTMVNAGAMRYGTRVGLYLIVAFCLYVAGLRYSAALGIVSLFVYFYVPIAFIFGLAMWKFVSNKGQVKFLRLLAFGLLTFLYASLLCSVAYYIYFQYMDHGFVVQNITNVLSDKASRDAIVQMTSAQQVGQMDIAMKQFETLTPIQITMQLLNVSFFIGSLVALIGAIIVANLREPGFMRKLRERIEKTNQDNIN